MSFSTTSSRPGDPLPAAMYAASVNPPRRAKLQAAASLLPALLPSPPESVSPPHTFSVTITSSSLDPTQPRKKRGRKPVTGTSSRAAREAARKANHSRIEKARRGKINNALQELKNLIPADFAAQRAKEEDDDDDFDDSMVSPTSKKDSRKKVSSEREFKLDILERTVLFVRELLHRVEDIGPSGTSDAMKHRKDCRCQCFQNSNTGNTRKRDSEEMMAEPKRKKQRTERFELYDQGHLSDGDSKDADIESNISDEDEDDATEDADCTMPFSSTSESQTSRVRLPSISELLSPQDGSTTTAQTIAVQLPSPSLSPHTFPQHYGSGNVNEACRRRSNRSYLSPSLSPSFTLRGSLSPLDGRPCGRIDEATDGRISCPVGMSALLTPPYTGSVSRHNVPSRAPTLRLPSSALDARDGSAQDVSTEGEEEEEEDDLDVEVDTGDVGARAASFALLQMRSRSYSRSEGKSALDSSACLSLTPGGLLGIRTGVKS